MPDTARWLFGEASLDDFMADPIVQLVMRSDQVSEGEFRALLRSASERLTRAPERAIDAQAQAQEEGPAGRQRSDLKLQGRNL